MMHFTTKYIPFHLENAEMGCFKIFNIYPPFLKTEIFNLAEMSFFERKLLITFFFPEQL